MPSPTRLRQILTCITAIVTLTLITAALAYKVMDIDFWWHVTAGHVMRSTMDIIRTDPFSWTREGQPYLATHGWLAQILLSLIFDAGGFTGIILFRIVMATLIFGLLLSLDIRSVWITGSLAVAGVHAARAQLQDRPQLFTFVFVALFLVLAYAYIDAGHATVKRRRNILCAFVALEVLWVNLHGAAGVIGLFIVGALVFQRCAGLFHQQDRREVLWLLVTLVGMTLALFASPNLQGNIVYLKSLLSDATVQFIQEWQPRPWNVLLPAMAPFGALAVAATLATRRAVVFSASVLIGTAWLARSAFRHEILFVLSAIGITIWQLRWNVRWQKALDRLFEKPLIAVLLVSLLSVIAAYFTFRSYTSFTQHDQLAGFGAFAPAEGAVDFLEREHIVGKMFNAYELGGYLIYRGKNVFVDGRNVEYGFPFLDRLMRAADDRAAWQQLENDYGIDIALIATAQFSNRDPLPYAGHLDANGGWALVYLDDWTAVYLRRTAAMQPVVDRLQYRLITPGRLLRGTVFRDRTDNDVPILERELRQAIDADARSIRARILLAQLYGQAGFVDEALALLDDAVRAQPQSYRPWEARGLLFMRLERWQEAATAFDRMLELAGDAATGVNEKLMEEVREKAQREKSEARKSKSE